MLPDMLATRSAKPRIAIIGGGNLASALAISLHAAGYAIDEVVSRGQRRSLQRARSLAREVGASVATNNRAGLRAEVVWFCVPDGEIASAANAVAKKAHWKGKVVLHSSGALNSDELDALRRRGAAAASVHPLMTFVRNSRPSLQGVAFALEGDFQAVRTARAIVRNLNAEPFSIRKRHKGAYHAWGMFTSPLFISLLSASECVAAAAGVPSKEAKKRMFPILRQTLANYEKLGAPQSLSGPIIRGDVETVRKHLQVLKRVSGARDIYLALARMGLQNLPTKNRTALEKALKD
jgi:predicted short-subunit dehydrogenase-like oxidoreductase (DUF2520 family)